MLALKDLFKGQQKGLQSKLKFTKNSNFIDRKYHAKNIVIDLYLFIHILNRRCRLDLPGNLAEIS